MAFEAIGLGCGSGPLTGRYNPPLGGALYFLRPGTTKMPLFRRMPVLGGVRRSVLDVALYIAYLLSLFRVLVAPAVTVELLIVPVVILPVLGLADKTIFLASRAEHYFTALVAFLFTLAEQQPAHRVRLLSQAAVPKLPRGSEAVRPRPTHGPHGHRRRVYVPVGPAFQRRRRRQGQRQRASQAPTLARLQPMAELGVIAPLPA